MTGINKIKHWRETFGLPNRTISTVTSQEEANLAINLIDEELNELVTATLDEHGNYAPKLDQIADAIGDLYFVVTQAAMIHGLDPEMLIDRVYTSNMSKGTSSKKEAEESVETYAQKGIETYYTETNGFYILKRSLDNKVLKMNSFVEPDWEFLK
jgi:predicted HAD superfamily Cof-like phosphohydrolase